MLDISRNRILVVATSGLVLLGVGQAPASAAPLPMPQVVASGLNGPFSVAYGQGRLFVAESGAGQVSAVDLASGAKSVVVADLNGPSGVAAVGGGSLAVITGGSEVPDASTYNGSASIFTVRDGRATLVADLQAYELANNPDGQPQFDSDGVPLDALSNPYSIAAGRGQTLALVADAGANAVLAISRSGDVSTFFVPPLVTSGPCASVPNNDPRQLGCDPVPTGVAYGPGGTVWVSTASALVPGQGRVYVLDGRTRAVIRTITGLSAPTGLAVAADGTAYVSEVLFNLSEDPALDPADVGRVVRIAPSGAQSTAAVTMPTGLAWHGGTLYSTAWSLAGLFLGIPDAGQVVTVPAGAFTT
ncbi:MAG: ScyD/ScyE family protein [Rhodoferax sp.]|nr:ScyD/ScyE family protein [Actinomycetota bacterium]